MKSLYRKYKLNKNGGFSLVELVIVIAIMAILISILVPQFIKYVEKSRIAKDETNADELMRAVQIAMSDEQIYTGVTATTTVTYHNSASGGGEITFGPHINAMFMEEVADSLKLTNKLNKNNGGRIDDPKLNIASKLHVSESYIITIRIEKDSAGKTKINIIDNKGSGWS